MGDFNYRIDLENEDIRYRIGRCDIDFLLTRDQLLAEKNKGNIFFDYKESSIEFLPTYRINSTSGDYDSGLALNRILPAYFYCSHLYTKSLLFTTSDDFRRPAWTDRYSITATLRIMLTNTQRILYRGDTINPIEYSCCYDGGPSDHRPVRGVYDVVVRLHSPSWSSIIQNTNSYLRKLRHEPVGKTDMGPINPFEDIFSEWESTSDPPKGHRGSKESNSLLVGDY